MKFLVPLFASLFLLTSCVIKGKTIKDVPTINSQNIHVTQLNNLPGKNLSLQVVDARKEDIMSAQLRSEVSRAVTEALTREGINVQSGSSNELVLTILDYETQEFKEGCVKIGGVLTIKQKARLKSDAGACFEGKSPFGPKMSADITKSYEEALTITFKNLNQSLGEVLLTP